MTDSHPYFSPKLLQAFLRTVAAEIGKTNLPIVLTKSGYPAKWADSENLNNLGGQAAAEIYAGVQQAIRAYYGRGARGTLQRIGSKFWEDLLENAPLKEKFLIKVIRGLPEIKRRKSAIDLLVRLVGAKGEEMSVHTLDLNLLLIDNISPTTYNQIDDKPICHLTHGLIQEALFWATSQEAHIEEIACQATGEKNCKFNIIFGEM